MFKTNEYFIYAPRGVCRIDDVCDKKVNDTTRTYYVFHPVSDKAAKIMIPVDNKKIFMRSIIDPKKAQQIIHYFHTSEMIPWDDNKKLRDKQFETLLKQSDAERLSEVLKVLLFQKVQSVSVNKKFADTDNRLLLSIQQLLYNELSVVLNLPYEKIDSEIRTAMNLG